MRSQMASIKTMANHLGLVVRSPDKGASRWTVLLIPGVSRPSLERLSSALPSAIQALLMPGWRPDRLRIAEAARYGDAILLNPAASPEVRLRGATAGSYELVSANGSEIAKGELVAYGDGFRIPPGDLSALAVTAVCEYRLNGVHSAVATKVPVLPAAPAVMPKQLPDPQSWLCDGHSAVLGSLELARPEAYRACISPQRLLRRDSGPVLPQSTQPDIADRSRRVFGWIGEVLLTRFQQRATLPFDEIKERVDSAAEAAGLPAWLVQRALFASGWIVRIQRRTAPFQEVALGERMLVTATAAGSTTARLCGLIGQHELIRLRGLLLEGESCVSTVPEPGQLAAGTWTLTLADASRATAIAENIGFRERRRTQPLPCPLAGALHLAVRSGKPLAPPAESNMWAWDSRNRRWSDDKANFAGAPILCNRGSQRYTYWVPYRTGSFQTDSFPWAWMLARWGAGEVLGILAEDGSVKWDPALPAIPLPLSYWWMQEGGGSLGIGLDGSILFLGGGGLRQWQGHFSGQAMPSEASWDRATDRRDLALGIRRSAGKKYQAV